jgi:UDPglucose 6-dehydrogenase/GDP-mannose 6-dehydrogenase
MRVSIIGTGYVGLVSGVCLAARGHSVTCVEINQGIVAQLNRGKPHIYERGLPELFSDVRRKGLLEATNDLESALDKSDLVIIAVGTPSKDGVIDLRFVLEVTHNIGNYIRRHDRHISVIVKSTVVPGTTDTVVRAALTEASGKAFPSFGLGMNPEFLREGQAIEDFMEPDRIVLGYEDTETLARLDELYAPWKADKLRVNTRTAELIKYANNALLATQISAINEIANLATAIGDIDIMDVVRGVHLDKRWNPITQDGGRISPAILTYLVPGCGFGGSCFPKDLRALRSQGEQHGLPMKLLNAVLDVNDSQPNQVLDIIERDLRSVAGQTALVLGLAFKPDTDDIRESASLRIVEKLVAKGAHVTAHDPIAIGNFRRTLGRIAEKVTFVDDWKSEVPKSAIIIVATKWKEYEALADADLCGKILFDARRMFSPSKMANAIYRSIGHRIRVLSSSVAITSFADVVLAFA